MGLDMDFYKVNGNGEKEHLHYFRKHSDLNGILQECWVEKNLDKDPGEFNCSEFEVTLDEVERIKNFMETFKNGNNKRYVGFFWGQSTEEDWEETKTLLEEITEIINDGQKVVYVPWW